MAPDRDRRAANTTWGTVVDALFDTTRMDDAVTLSTYDLNTHNTHVFIHSVWSVYCTSGRYAIPLVDMCKE
jgi:hypothetical protein